MDSGFYCIKQKKTISAKKMLLVSGWKAIPDPVVLLFVFRIQTVNIFQILSYSAKLINRVSAIYIRKLKKLVKGKMVLLVSSSTGITMNLKLSTDFLSFITTEMSVILFTKGFLVKKLRLNVIWVH